MTKTAPLIAAAFTLACLVAPARADDITDQLEAARKAYEAGDLRSAAQTLQFTAAAIQEKINLSLLDLLPAPLEGWAADEPEAQSGGMAAMIAGTTLTRRYHREDGAEVEVTITADSPLLSMMTMMFTNPMLLQSNPGTRVYTHAGHRGTVQHEPDSKRWEINLMLGGNVLIQVVGSNVEGREVVEQYLKALDLQAVQQAFSG